MADQFAPQAGGNWSDRLMQRLQTPGSELALRILAGNRGGASFGNVLGGAVLGQQQDAMQRQQQMSEGDLKRRYMEAQIKAMGMPNPQAQSAPVIIRGPDGKPQYATREQALGQEPWENSQGAPSQAASIQEFNQAKTSGFNGSFLDFLKARGDAGSNGPAPSYQFIQGADGQWYAGNARTGGTAPTGVGAPAKPIDAAAQKQSVGMQNLGIAVDEYVKELPNFRALDLLNPTARASMGTKYNNMMLQAKEAYNLGVLNGPDLAILENVVTNPMTPKGAITSNEALAKQATELKRIMEKMRGNVISGKPSGAAPGGAPPALDDPLGLR